LLPYPTALRLACNTSYCSPGSVRTFSTGSTVYWDTHCRQESLALAIGGLPPEEQPGIHVRRYCGHELSGEEIISLLLKAFNGHSRAMTTPPSLQRTWE